MRVKKSIDRLPDHLKAFVVEQTEGLYTPMDHAVWRYILRVSKEFFKDHAHQKYLDGLVETGIETEHIPLIDEVDLCLSQFGWGAVPVSGFIPPGIFMELLSEGVMPIAADIRNMDHVDYTPSPDIVHEAAGHAPIIADVEYAKFLHDCGEIARKCILTRKDMDLYDAVLRLSNAKEDTRSTKAQIAAAEAKLQEAIAANDFVSEATEFGRMIWWTVEYGLVGSLENPKIYGAGLLSSVSESFHCLGPKVRKIPFGLDCIKYSYDITEPQPQLFVTPDFATLSRVAEEFAATLAYKRGGVEGLQKAARAAYTTTCVLDSGLQISGVLAAFRTDADEGAPTFVKYTGPVQLAYADGELPGQGVEHHKEGFSSPLGPLKETGRSASQLTAMELKRMGLRTGARVRLEYASGIVVDGVFKNLICRDQPLRGEPPSTEAPRTHSLQGDVAAMLPTGAEILVMTFQDCKVTAGAEVLFDPSWGVFDLACGGRVASVFGGAADRPRYPNEDCLRYRARKPVPNLTAENKPLSDLYARVRSVRESGPFAKGGHLTDKQRKDLDEVCVRLDAGFSGDWLLRLEILELEPHGGRAHRLREQLHALARESTRRNELIGRGLRLLATDTGFTPAA